MMALYLTPDAERFFLVPDGYELPAGDVVIVTLAGDERRVHGGALVPVEITRDQAEAHVRARAERAAGAVADTIGLALGGRDEIAERLGLSERRLRQDPKATREALDHLIDDLNAVMAAVSSGEASALDAARRRLAARGIDLGDTFDDLARHLEAIRRLDRDDAAHAAASGLRALADAIEGSGEQPLGRRIDELIERLDREVGPFVGIDREREERRRQAEYEASAKSAIADALRARGITPLASAEPENEPDDTN